MKMNFMPGSFDELVSLYDYERTDRIPTEMTGIEQREGAIIHELSYAGLGQEKRIRTYFVTPADGGGGTFPAVIYVHPAPGDRSTFLEEAIQLAKRGNASLLVDAPWAQGETWARTLKTPEYNREVFVSFVKDLCRAVDFLATRPEVHSNRIGFVGHSLGALFGGVLSGVEKRIKAFAFMAGAPSFTDVALLNNPSLKGEDLAHYAEVMQSIDPVFYVAHATPSALFFQFGRKDEAFSQDQFERFAQAGSEPKLVQWYETDHFFQNGEGQNDRLEWLHAQLLI
jgi:dienelactone hydrolase